MRRMLPLVLSSRRALAGWLCGLALLAVFGMPWFALVHAEAHHHGSRLDRAVTTGAPTADHDDGACVLCQLLSATVSPAELADAPDIGEVALIGRPLAPTFARGPPVSLVSAAPLARGPPYASLL